MTRTYGFLYSLLFAAFVRSAARASESDAYARNIVAGTQDILRPKTACDKISHYGSPDLSDLPYCRNIQRLMKW
jgi:hypothetical protein